jgi:hypothetical protein
MNQDVASPGSCLWRTAIITPFSSNLQKRDILRDTPEDMTRASPVTMTLNAAKQGLIF